MQLTFLGATQTVTGSKYLIETGQQKILVDCGLFQGVKELRLKNWSPLPISPRDIDAVLLTHAHLDHSGYLPLLVKNGFNGTIYATPATIDLCKILLPDSGHLQEEDAKRANIYGHTKHHPALPLYTISDAENALKHFKAVDFNQSYSLFQNAQITWRHAGHILGASMIQCEMDGCTLLFSGDLGRLNDPIIKAPAMIEYADYIVLESTYGNRLHDKSDVKESIANIINTTARRGGNVLIPAFAVGRAQSILYYLYELKKNHLIPDLPIYLDSPMAIDATGLMSRYHDEHKLSTEICHQACHIANYTQTPLESKAIDHMDAPRIIISASGMMTGGRVLHHLKVMAPDPKNTILITGFQAAGTRGARLLNGEEEIKIHGDMFPVRASVCQVTNISAHTDYEETLTWLSHLKHPPRRIFITHGEYEAAQSLKIKIEQTLGFTCTVPAYLQRESL